MPEPLSGWRIVDLTHEWAGPHAARLMADFGAEVIKVEYFRRLDHMRGANKINRAYDRHARFLQLNRNKRSLALDLRDALDRGVFEDLVRSSNVVLSNSRPGVLERLGYGFAALRHLKADIILVALSACGQTGPHANYAGYGGGLEATSGVQSLTAYGPAEKPRRIREMDVTNGIMGAVAIVTALMHHQATGKGTFIDLSEIEAPAHALAAERIMEVALKGASVLPLGNRDASNAPHGVYPCQGEDTWIAISVDTGPEWLALCTAIGRPDCTADQRFATRESRLQHHDALDELISFWTRQHDKLTAMKLLQASGITAGAVLDVSDLAKDPHLTKRGYFRYPTCTPHEFLYPGFPFRLSAGGGEVATGGPPLGEANQYVIRDLLRRDPVDVREIREDEIGTDFDVGENSI
ncbi:MAG TPA: CoA transferase [Terriglobia bacterium]|nr:CoA transferase [Terriglobia bacterium]